MKNISMIMTLAAALLLTACKSSDANTIYGFKALF